jgi:hypothetical protein
MSREEILEKLSNINICVANITYTYDIGLMFDVLSSVGIASEQGYNFSQWPCFKFPITNDFRNLIHRIKDGKEIDDNELLSNSVFKEICTVHGYNDSFMVCDTTLTKCIRLIQEEAKVLDDTLNSFYAYVSIENWSVNLKFFSTYKDLVNYFKDECGYLSFIPWEEMNDDELEGWYQVAEENDWDGVPYMEISGNN